MKRKLFPLLLLCSLTLALLTGCSGQAQQPANDAPQPEQVSDQHQTAIAPETTFAVTALKGPTAMGLVPIAVHAARGATENGYDLTVAAAPDEAAARLIKGEADIAALPVNLAANLYQKLDGDLQMLAINTLGVLYILENGDSVHTMADLAGKTLYATGQGATPEYILNALLAGNQLSNVQVTYLTEHSELAVRLAEGNAALGMLPEPNATVALQKSSQLRRALDLTAEWEKIYPDTPLVQGCIVAKKSFIADNQQAIDTFLTEYQQSIEYAVSDPKDAGWHIAEFGILEDAAVAEESLPNCNLCCLTGKEMQQAADQMFQVLYAADPKSVGGSLPPADLYYGVK